MPTAESERIRLLHALNLLDTDPEPVFDRITRLLAHLLELPYAGISLIDSQRLWFKSRVGLPMGEMPREYALCAHAIGEQDALVIADTRLDPRSADNPLLRDPSIRFYAGIALRSSTGHALGALCAMDDKPRQLNAEQLALFLELAALATREIHLREASLLSSQVLESSAKKIARSEARFRSIFDLAAIGIALVAPDGHWLEINDELCATLGYSQAELRQLTFQEITHPDDLGGDLALLDDLIRRRIDRYQMEKRYIRKDGQPVWARLTVTAHWHGEQIDHFVSVVQNIQAHKEAEAALARLHEELENRVASRTRELSEAYRALSEAMNQQLASDQALRRREAELSAVIENAGDAYIGMSQEGLITAWNPMAERTFGYSREQAVGQPLEALIIPPDQHPRHRAGVARYFSSGVSTMLGQRREMIAQRSDGSLFPIEVRVNAVEINGQTIFSAFLHEISERKEVERRREREALQDPLTQLPNRRALHENLGLAMERCKSGGREMALVFIDLDGFKQVNDSLGHEAGDALLKEIATRLRASLRGSDSVYRLAGDEFTLVLEGLTEPAKDALRIGEKLLKALCEPMQLGEACARVGGSIGISLFGPDDPRGQEQLLRDADAAMYQAKRSGKGQICLL